MWLSRTFATRWNAQPFVLGGVASAAPGGQGARKVLMEPVRERLFLAGEAVHETTDETWSFLFDLNARSMLNTVRAVVPHMLQAGGGKIVNVGANSALKGVAHMGAYCASKSVVIRLTESMAAELREKKINVNFVLPTTIDTPENRAAMPNADPARWVAPKDLAAVILFLCSQAARAVHGAAIPVSGLS